LRYTTLRVTGAGVVLHDLHAGRLAPEGPKALAAFRRFAREAAPGVYGLAAAEGRLRIEPLGGTRLVAGMPVRRRVSPFATRCGAFPKPGPGGAYDAVRVPGIATLLTSADGTEIYESCVAAVVGWDGARLVCVPDDRPRVASLAEAAARQVLPWANAPLRAAADLPLILLNAVAGPCPVDAGRPPVPAEVVAALERAMTRLTCRP